MSETPENPPPEQSAQDAAAPDRPIVRWVVAAVTLLILVGYPCYVQVEEGTAVVVTRFGQPIRELTEPGPSLKLPWPIEEARVIDTRQHLLNTPYTATLTQDRRNVVLTTYVVWHVAQPLRFLQAVGDTDSAAAKIDGMVTAAKNTRLGGYNLTALVSTDAGEVRTSQIEREILEEVASAALGKFGIEIQQVGISRIAYEATNVEAVLAQMRAEREAAAKQLRAVGEKEARAIRDSALVKSEEILRDGRLEAGDIRADAERQAAEIYAQAHRIDPEFYRYWRSLEALKRTLGENSTVILRTNQGFFDLLTNPPEVREERRAPDPSSPNDRLSLEGPRGDDSAREEATR
ncbi:MAG: protease modulator HflC [Pirellulaceae bacterium]